MCITVRDGVDFATSTSLTGHTTVDIAGPVLCNLTVSSCELDIVMSRLGNS